MPSRAHVILCIAVLFTSVPAAADVWPYRDQLRAETRFWKNIFTKYDDDCYVVHDPDDLSLVYRVISFDASENEGQRARQLAAAKYALESSLRSLAGKLPGAENLTVQEKQLRELFGTRATPEYLRLCASRIRTQRGIADRFYQGMQRSALYLPVIKKIFRDKGLPESLAYLPHVESSFDLRARSKAGAAGMWQFMRPTAKLFSIKMNAIVDERYDPLVASEAAAQLLKQNYDELGDWGLALTAYNYGLAGMSEASERCGADYMTVRRRYYNPRFQFASKNFYPEFLAVLEIMENPVHPGHTAAVKDQPQIIQHRLKAPATLPALARNWGMELARLRELNPGYSKKAWDGRLTIPAGYSINIPASVRVPMPKAHITQDDGPAQKKEYTVGPSRSDTRVAPAGELSLEQLGRELAPVLAVENKSIKVFADESIGLYATWLKVPSRALCSMNNLSEHHSLRQQQLLRLDFSRVSEAEFTQARLSHHLAAVKSMLQKHKLEELIRYRMSSSDSLPQLAHEHFKIPPSLIVYFNPDQNLKSLPPGSVIRIPVSRQAARQIL